LNSPIVTILLPVYNAEKYLAEAIQSILAQTFTDFELIAVNDGSIDKSIDILKDFAKNDSRLKVYSNEVNRGIVFTLNRGLYLASGEYIARMDADDICLPERLAKQVAYLSEHPDIGVLGTNFLHFGNVNKVSNFRLEHELIVLEMIFVNSILHPSIMMRKSVLDRIGVKYSDKFMHIEDWDLWCRLIPHTKFHNLPDVLIQYRVEGQNISIKNKNSSLERLKLFYTHHLEKLFFDFNKDYLSKHMILSNRFYDGSDIKSLKNYVSFLSNMLREQGHAPRKIKIVIDSKLNNLFFTIADLSVYKAFIFLSYFRMFEKTKLRYLLSKLIKKRANKKI
jgi:glycosyltransferase involved in cell wall biosynthesis